MTAITITGVTIIFIILKGINLREAMLITFCYFLKQVENRKPNTLILFELLKSSVVLNRLVLIKNCD